MLKQPLFLSENRVFRTYRGGKQLDLFLGKENPQDSFQPEDWISSFVEAKNKNYIPGEGLSTVLVNGIAQQINDVIQPEDFGPGRLDSGILIKLLNAEERLGIQVHPTPAFSREHFGTNYGKTECWHILDTSPGASIYVGFKAGISKEKWMDLYNRQDISGMLSCLHKFEAQKGDTILVTAGTPHAIGAGCFLLEVQEPTDYTMRVEKVTVAGEVLTPMQIHYDAGEKALFDCFHYEPLSLEKARETYFLTPHNQYLVTYNDTPCFALQKITGGNVTITLDSFVTLIVTDGGTLLFHDKANITTPYPVKKGDRLFVPYGCNAFTVVDAEVMVCHPPRVTSSIPKPQ